MTLTHGQGTNPLPQLERRPTHKVVPLLRSEVSRIMHRRLYRVLALLLLAGIVVISTIVFFAHSTTPPDISEERLQQRHAQAEANWARCAQGFTDEDMPGATLEEWCGPEPADQPDVYSYGRDDRYRAAENLPLGLIAAAIAAAGVAFLVGASSGGAEWSSRSMTLQLLYEPRRLRLLVVKWLGLVIAVGALAVVAMATTVGLGAITASLRGTWDRQFAPVSELEDQFWATLALMGLRGLFLVSIAATVGYAIAMLVRNTGASLGVAFVYFVVLENGIRIALLKYGTEPFMLSTNSVASLFPGGLDVPGAETNRFEPSSDVELTNLRASMTMLVYTALIAVPAAWSFTRRDVQ